MRYQFLVVTSISMLACALPAHAGRPLQTDDAGVVERGACELEAGGLRDSAGGVTGRTGLAQLTCGIPAASELAVAAYRSHRDGGTAQVLELAGKTLLSGSAASGGDAPPSSSLSYTLAWARTEVQGWRHAATRVNFVHSRSLAPELSLHANLGHARYQQDRRSATTWGLGIEHAGFGALAPMAELTGDDHAAPYWSAGLRWTPPAFKSLSVDMAYGQQLASGRPRLMTVGLTQAF